MHVCARVRSLFPVRLKTSLTWEGTLSGFSSFNLSPVCIWASSHHRPNGGQLHVSIIYKLMIFTIKSPERCFKMTWLVPSVRVGLFDGEVPEKHSLEPEVDALWCKRCYDVSPDLNRSSERKAEPSSPAGWCRVWVDCFILQLLGFPWAEPAGCPCEAVRVREAESCSPLWSKAVKVS